MLKSFIGAGLAAGCLVCGSADAANVAFVGAVANVCILTVTTPGVIAAASSGTALSSDATGGAPAMMTIAATGAAPTVLFTAPQLAGPAASTSGATTTMEFSSPGGANQAFTGSASSYAMSRLIDTITLKGQAVNAAGFVTGTYTISSVATCQQ